MRLLEERRGSAVISYVYEPDSYVPLARLDAEGERTEQGGLGTTQDVQQPGTSKTIAASAGQSSAGGQKHQNRPNSQQAANDTLEDRYWQALNPKGTVQNTGTDGPSANAKLCEVYYFHTDQVGLPEELSNTQGQIIWQAQYKTWGSTVEERWEARPARCESAGADGRGYSTGKPTRAEPAIPGPIPGPRDGAALQHVPVLRCGHWEVHQSGPDRVGGWDQPGELLTESDGLD